MKNNERPGMISNVFNFISKKYLYQSTGSNRRNFRIMKKNPKLKIRNLEGKTSYIYEFHIIDIVVYHIK